jgi:hypothetical protein
MALRKLRLPMAGRVAEIQIARARFNPIGPCGHPEKNHVRATRRYVFSKSARVSTSLVWGNMSKAWMARVL